MNSNQLYLSLVRDTLEPSFNSGVRPLEHIPANDSQSVHSPQGRDMSKTSCALWLQTGELEINRISLATGEGVYMDRNDIVNCTDVSPTVILRFIVSSLPLVNNETAHCEILFSEEINTTAREMLLRLDQVDFPAAAVAHKHTHPGPGIRFLVDGGLTLSSEHGEQTIMAGDSWFEEANSPVRATAIKSMPSRFVRAMLLPLEYEGRSTFTLHSQSDAHKPMLQSNIRHFEKRISHPNAH